MADKQDAPATMADAAQNDSSKLKSIVSVFNKDPKKIRELVGNHVKNLEECIPIITKSGGCSLSDLERFIVDVKRFNTANGFENPGIGIYLFRENMYDRKFHKNGVLLPAEKLSLSQISFVLAPIEFDARRGEIIKHYINETIDEIPAMIPSNEGTGLCPPSCKS